MISVFGSFLKICNRMKYSFFIFFATLSTLLSAQVGDSFSSPHYDLVGEVSSLRRFIRLEKKAINEGKSLYVFSFSNREYIHLDDVGVISFSATEDELNKFKNYLLSGFELEKDKDIRFRLGESAITIERILGKTIKMIVYSKGGSSEGFLYIKPREIPLIFGEN